MLPFIVTSNLSDQKSLNKMGLIESQAGQHRSTMPFLQGANHLGDDHIPPKARFEAGPEANTALEFCTASVLREPEAPPDVGPVTHLSP